MRPRLCSHSRKDGWHMFCLGGCSRYRSSIRLRCRQSLAWSRVLVVDRCRSAMRRSYDWVILIPLARSLWRWASLHRLILRWIRLGRSWRRNGLWDIVLRRVTRSWDHGRLIWHVLVLVIIRVVMVVRATAIAMLSVATLGRSRRSLRRAHLDRLIARCRCGESGRLIRLA